MKMQTLDVSKFEAKLTTMFEKVAYEAAEPLDMDGYKLLAQKVKKHLTSKSQKWHFPYEDDYEVFILQLPTNRPPEKKKMKKVHLRVNSNNARAIHVYEKCGFKIEARFEKERFQEGKYRDEYQMSIFL